MKRRLRWDESCDCELCGDLGTYLFEDGKDWIEVICACESGDEAHELESLRRDGWAA